MTTGTCVRRPKDAATRRSVRGPWEAKIKSGLSARTKRNPLRTAGGYHVICGSGMVSQRFSRLVSRMSRPDRDMSAAAARARRRRKRPARDGTDTHWAPEADPWGRTPIAPSVKTVTECPSRIRVSTNRRTRTPPMFRAVA
jgi:hypothetical protein